MPLTLRYVACSDTGLVREGNEDAGYAGPYLLAVADGMGGHAAGEVASVAAIDELAGAEGNGSDPLAALTDAIHAANNRIRQLIADDAAREGMGTTITAMLWTGSGFVVAHAGDSRAYRLRDGRLQQLTHDHTFVQALVDDGRITAEDAREHPARSVLTKALQGQEDCDVDRELIDAKAGDRILVCSDGLTDAVPDEAIAQTLASSPSLDGAAEALLERSRSAGAPDNVTIILADVLDLDQAAPATAAPVRVGAAGA